jgi:ADP-ribose pyrophosphatase
MAAPRFTRADVEVLEDRSSYRGFFEVRTLKLRHRRFAGDWSPALQRELVLRREAVGVLLYDPQLDSVALVEQFRIGALSRGDSPWLLELVAGLIDSGETPQQVAHREALEEANCTVLALEPALGYFSSPGGSNEFFHLFCGRCALHDAGGIHGLAEEGEDIRVHVVSVDDALRRMGAGEFCNAHTLIALQWLQLHRPRLRALWC